ncbi:hypothetical protein FA10DRAFT_216217, partial [Acaromyces ingoldii]
AAYSVLYSNLKLKGLTQSPDAFSSTLASESGLSDAAKLARLTRTDRSVFVVEDTHTHEWVGQVVLVGPLTLEEYTAPFEGAPPTIVTDEKELQVNRGGDAGAGRHFWHLTSLYVDVDHRKRGLANDLCDAAYAFIQRHKASDSGKAQTQTLRIIIKPGNLVVVKMYERMDFHLVEDRRATLAEAIRCSGEEELPSDYRQKPQFNTRGGLIMVKTL